jgi:hypothetical protein
LQRKRAVLIFHFLVISSEARNLLFLTIAGSRFLVAALLEMTAFEKAKKLAF